MGNWVFSGYAWANPSWASLFFQRLGAEPTWPPLDTAEGRPDKPAGKCAGGTEATTLESGLHLGPYEILAPLGTGSAQLEKITWRWLCGQTEFADIFVRSG